MGNCLVLPVKSDKCFSKKSNPALPPDLPAEDSDQVKPPPPPEKLFNRENNDKLTEAQVEEEGRGALLLPSPQFREASNLESVKVHRQIVARVEERTGALLLPHQVFEKASNCESVDAQKQTKAQVEERGGALLLPHQLIKKANNCSLVETQAGKRYPGVLLPHEFFQATL
ncbi:hypothetical protein NC651_014526 [Populus alba x Populus x berolinensis]|nr:hypothetical protein NC651_014526 [Populus alba x Populus x berolinensis]